MLGNNGYNDPRVVRFRGVPMLIAQIDLVYTDGTTDTAVSYTHLARVRPCTVMASAPPASTARATSTATSSFS